MTNKSEERVKQPYTKPRVERYGNLRDLTKQTGQTGNNDHTGQTGNVTKTHL